MRIPRRAWEAAPLWMAALLLVLCITARSCAAMGRQEAPYRTRYRTYLTIEIAMIRIIGCAAPSSHAPRPPAFDFALTWGHGIVSAFFHNFQPPTASPNFSCALLNSRTYRPGVIKPRVSTRACRPSGPSTNTLISTFYVTQVFVDTFLDSR